MSFTEVAKQPKGQEWLWHPQVVPLYNSVLEKCQENATTREAAAGALHNITGGDQRVGYKASHCLPPRGATLRPQCLLALGFDAATF